MRSLLKVILMFFALAISAQMTFGQDIYVPKKYKLENSSDYRAHAPAVERCLKWLLDTPLHEYPEKRAEANAFVMLWVTGTPTMTIETSSSLMPFIKKNEELFYTFVHALTLHHLQHEEVQSDSDLEFALIEVIKMYRKSKNLRDDDEMKELRRARRWGRLDKWIAEHK